MPFFPHEANPGDMEATAATAKMKLACMEYDGFLAGYFPAAMALWKDEEKN